MQLLAWPGAQTTRCLWGKRDHDAKGNNPGAAAGGCWSSQEEPGKPDRECLTTNQSVWRTLKLEDKHI